MAYKLASVTAKNFTLASLSISELFILGIGVVKNYALSGILRPLLFVFGEGSSNHIEMSTWQGDVHAIIVVQIVFVMIFTLIMIVIHTAALV